MMTYIIRLKSVKTILIAIFILWSADMYGRTLKVGLALGGGGAKGAATIGVLKAIEEAGLRIDCIAGTSIGAIVGGLYASGVSVTELERLFLSQEWSTILSGRGMEQQLEEILSRYSCRDFRNTRIPFSCVTTDYQLMEEVVLNRGFLPKAIRASMSIPVVYEPVIWNDGRRLRRLVDGGLVNNLPVDVVKGMNVDVVIAVDLQQGKDVGFGFSLRDLLGIRGLTDWYFSRPDIVRYERNVQNADIHIHPDLRGLNVASFNRYHCEIMIERGYDEAKSFWKELLLLKARQ